MDLPFKTHFGAHCETCNSACLFPVEGEVLAACERDPVEGLRALTEEQQEAIGDFFAEHLSHEVAPTLVALAPMPEA